MAQKSVIVTIERSDDHENQLQEALDRKAALTAGSTGIPVVNYGTKITDAQNAQTAVSTRAPGTAQARDDKFQLMFEEEEDLRGQMQVLVNNLAGSIDQKVALALSNGFQVVDFGTINKQDFVVVDGPGSGFAKLVAKAFRGYSFHEWGYSSDEGQTWIYVEPSLQATKIIGSLEVTKNIKFRHRLFTKDGPGEYHFDELVIR